jgi:hypothetical protein
VKFTETQLYWLQEMRKAGGRARVEGLHVVIGGEKSNAGATLSFLHLCARGALRGEGGELRMTAYGYRVCNFEPPNDLVDPALDRQRLDFIESEAVDLRCREQRMMDDADVYYEVVDFWMKPPTERKIGHGGTPRRALDDAVRIKRSVPDTCEAPTEHPHFCGCEKVSAT